MSDSKISNALSLLEDSLKENGEDVKQLLQEKYAHLHDIFTEDFAVEIPPASLRVPLNTSERAQKRIRLETVENIAACLGAGPEQINRRLKELDYESDIERVIAINASSLSLFGLTLSIVNRRWIILPMTVAYFLLQHGIQGWCPPVPVLRGFGVRTRREIDDERNILKRIRGDFGEFQSQNDDPHRLAVELLNAQTA